VKYLRQNIREVTVSTYLRALGIIGHDVVAVVGFSFSFLLSIQEHPEPQQPPQSLATKGRLLSAQDRML